MPMLADIEDPPRSRLPGMLLGLALASPVVAVFAIWVIPTFVGTILSGASDLDERLRATDRYMRELCAGQIDTARDEGLCGCVWSVEFPSLDCRPHFNAWAADLQQSRCDDGLREDSLSYCTCVDAIVDKMNAAGDEPAQRRSAANNYENCEALGDAKELPAPAELAPPYE
ncbi:MAG: hypothetical protein ACE37F_03030 [Nannocystaceae bacterium]|nr:hypothetical protein [bacterium]